MDRKNNFDLIRLVAALAVLYGHSYALSGGVRQRNPVSLILGPWAYAGHLAVLAFFLISGMLIMRSFERSNKIRYGVMRVARIWPDLLACLFFTVFLIGPIFTDLSLWDYFSDRELWIYLRKNMFLDGVYYFLPGVFKNNHYPGVVNGSLWTLPVEIRLYILVFVVGSMGMLKTPVRAAVSVLVFSIIAILPESYPLYFNGRKSTQLPSLFFACGVLIYQFRRILSLRSDVLLFLFLVYFVSRSTPWSELFFYPFFIYLVMVASSSKFLMKFRIPSDFSYGIYIYGFPIQQAVEFMYPGIGPLPSLLISVPIVVTLAMISWRYIEKPSLVFARKRLDAAKAPATDWTAPLHWTLQGLTSTDSGSPSFLS